jgi:hypothetical protein
MDSLFTGLHLLDAARPLMLRPNALTFSGPAPIVTLKGAVQKA